MFKGLILILSLASLTFSQPDNRLVFSINYLWNGTAVNHVQNDNVTVELSTNPDGDLVLTASGPFFDHLTAQEDFDDENCPTRPYSGLWQYEVAEAFFLNDNDEYLEVEINPRGKYYILLLDGYRNAELDNLPLFPNGVKWSNECAANEIGCRWTATAIIPKEYMPEKVTKFNAYAIHHMHNDKNDPIYEAFSPVDLNKDKVSGPDFHYFGAFEDIDLTAIGFRQDEKSDLWRSATSEVSDYSFNYSLVTESDCQTTNIDAEYKCNVNSLKRTKYQNFIISFQTEGDKGEILADLATSGPNTALDIERGESFWFTYTSESGQMLRVGINPAKAYRVSLIDSDGKILNDGIELESAFCASADCGFQCDVSIPWALLPANVTHFQMLHARGNVVTALCPNSKTPDWIGCWTDVRTVAERRQDHSAEWIQALQQ